MANSFVQLNTGTGGPKAQSYQNTISGNVVDANAAVLTDTTGVPKDDYATLFYDEWAGTVLDVTDKWTVTGTTPTIASGLMTMPATVSTYNAIRTKDTIRSNVGYTLVRNGIALETSAAVGAGRFWGLGTPATTPAAAVLAQDGIGFEIDQATGALLAVTYAAGVRTTIATLTRPSDGTNHAYGVFFRVTQAFWVVDGVTVASASFPNVQVAGLPALIVRQNAASFTGTPVFTNIAHLTADTAKQTTVVADPVVGTRQARVKAASTAVAATDNALAVGLHPSSPLPSGTNSIGAVTITQPTRVPIVLSASGVTSVTAVALMTLNIYKGGVVTSATNYTVTLGKTFRIQAVQFGMRFITPSTTVTFASNTFALRFVTTGTVVVGSPILLQDSKLAASNTATPNSDLTIPEGLDIPTLYNFGITHLASAVTLALDVMIVGYEY